MEWIAGVIGVLVLCIMGYYAVIVEPRKEEAKRNQRKAFELTKQIGDKKIRFVSLKTTMRGDPGRAFVLMEEGADKDSTKQYFELGEGWDNSAHSIETAQKGACAIVNYMPYDVWLEQLDVTRYDFFLPRVHDQKKKELEKAKARDREKMSERLIGDLDKFDTAIVRYEHHFTDRGHQFKDYYYLLKVNCEDAAKYLFLFNYEDKDIQYAEERVKSYISFFNKFNGKLSEKVEVVDQEINDFLSTHPYYTHQWLYSSLDSIMPYYETADDN